MAKYGILLKEDGTLFSGFWYKEQDLPDDAHIPPGAKLVTFDETRSDYEFLYAYFIEDTNKITSTYLPLQAPGAFTYNFDTAEFTFNPMPEGPSLLDQVREERNRRIAATDVLVAVPDYPADLMAQVLVYRQALRDITVNPDPSWTDPSQFPWPEKPHFI